MASLIRNVRLFAIGMPVHTSMPPSVCGAGTEASLGDTATLLTVTPEGSISPRLTTVMRLASV